MKILKRIILAVSLSFIAFSAHAQVVFTIDAICDSSFDGYTQDEIYTFTFSLNPNFTNAPTLESYMANWAQVSEPTLEPQWINLGGSAVSGTFSPGVGAPGNFLEIDNSSQYFNLYVVGQGTTTLGGATILGVTLEGVLTGVYPFDIPLTSISAYDYFLNYGSETSYNFSASSSPFSIRASTGGPAFSVDFIPTKLTVSAIPEPSSLVLLGVAGVAAIGLTRRCRSMKLKGMS